MKAVIPASKLSAWAKTIQCMAKIGDDLFIEALEDKMIMRAFNSSISAFVCFSFYPSFFETYKVSDDAENYRLVLKACVAVFRSVTSVDKCTMEVDSEHDCMLFDMHCKHGIKKTYKVDAVVCESMQAVFSKDKNPSRLAIQARLLNASLSNFPANLDEITMVLDHEAVKIRSYVGKTMTDDFLKKNLLTELILKAADFDIYETNNKVPVELTFCLKEMKAILNFCDKQGLGVNIFCEVEGKPVVISVAVPHTYEAEFVLATLPDTSSNESQTSQGANRSTQQGSSQTSRSSQHTPSTSSAPIHSSSSSSSKRPLSPDHLQQPPQKKKKVSQDNNDDGADMLWDTDLDQHIIGDDDD